MTIKAKELVKKCYSVGVPPHIIRKTLKCSPGTLYAWVAWPTVPSPKYSARILEKMPFLLSRYLKRASSKLETPGLITLEGDSSKITETPLSKEIVLDLRKVQGKRIVIQF